jgi:hypothetical protein
VKNEGVPAVPSTACKLIANTDPSAITLSTSLTWEIRDTNSFDHMLQMVPSLASLFSDPLHLHLSPSASPPQSFLNISHPSSPFLTAMSASISTARLATSQPTACAVYECPCNSASLESAPMNASKICSLANVAANGTRPPVSSFACTLMSGSTQMKVDEENRPRRKRPVNTSSWMIGRPAHVLGAATTGAGLTRELEPNREEFARTTRARTY